MLQGYLSELLLIHIPEAIALSFVIAFFLRVKLEYKKIILIAVINAIIILIFRSIPMLTFGYHTIISLLFYVMLFNYFFKENVIDIFFAAIKTYIILIIYELIFINLMSNLLKISVGELSNDFVLNAITLWIKIIFIFLTGYISFRFISKKKVKEEVM